MEQNRKRYSSLAKAIVIGLQMIAAVVASVSIVLFSTCVNQNMLNMGDLQNSWNPVILSGRFRNR